MTDTVALAGRKAELRTVSALVTGESDAVALLVVGDAGVGKSRLVAAAADAATRAGVVVVSGWCLPLSEGLPFLPVVDVLRGLATADNGRLMQAALDECSPFVCREVLRLLPDLREPTPSSMPAEPNDGWQRQRLFDALRQLLDALRQRHRSAVVIEDVQWADATTLDFLDYLLTPGHATGVPMVLTCRSEDAAATHTLADWVERLQRNPRVRPMDLTAMTVAETAQQIERLLGRRPSRKLVARTYARSEGNAFFTEQLVAAGSVDRESHPMPASLRSLLLSRTRQVTGTASRVLSALAVAARPLDEAAVAKLCERPEHEVREALRDLLGRRLLRRPDPAGRHQVRHALLAEAVSGDLLPSDRFELHARVAELMAGWNAEDVAAEVAEHFASARSADELRWRVFAGRHADAVFASTEAAEQWHRVLGLCAGAPITQVVEGMSLAQLYGAAVDAFVLSGNEEKARELAEDALDRLAAADPASRADVLRRAGEIRGWSSPEPGLAMLYQALALYDELLLRSGQLKTLREIASIRYYNGQQTEAADAIEQAAALTKPGRQLTVDIEVQCQQAWYEMASGDEAELAMDRLRKLREHLAKHDRPALQAWQAMVHTSILFDLGRLTEVEAAAAAALQMATAYGIDQSFRVAIIRWNVFEALIELGSIAAAARLIDPVSEEKVSLSICFDHDARATLEMLRGNQNEVKKRRIEIRRLPPAWLGFQARTGLWEAEQHLWAREPEAKDAFERSNALLVRASGANQGILSGPLVAVAGPLLILALRACADLAEQARAGRDVAALDATHRQANQLTELHHVMKPDPFTAGRLRPAAAAYNLMWHAESSRLRGESDEKLWEQAANEWDALLRPHRAAYARWRQAEALLARPGGRTAAGGVLQTAERQAVQHVPLLNAIYDLARRARVDLSPPAPPAQPPTATAAPFGLTDRELEVLELLARGKTNSEIGAALFISRKTASVHVSNILRKLDVTTRVQAATVAERAGLFAPTAISDR